MELVLEILFEIFIEGLVDASGNPKVPMVIRLLIMTILCGSLTAIMILIGLSVSKNAEIAGAIICWIFALVFACFWVYSCRRILRTRNNSH